MLMNQNHINQIIIYFLWLHNRFLYSAQNAFHEFNLKSIATVTRGIEMSSVLTSQVFSSESGRNAWAGGKCVYILPKGCMFSILPEVINFAQYFISVCFV